MLKKIWDHLEEYILIFSYLLIIPLLTCQVVSRFVFRSPLTWSEEVARFIFIWQVWLGAAYCVQKDRHIRIDIFTFKLKPLAHKVFEICIIVFCLGFCGFLIYKGMEKVIMLQVSGQTSPALKIPMYMVYLSVPVSSVLMFIRYIESLVKQIKTPAEVLYAKEKEK